MNGYPRVCANCKWWVPTCEDGDSYSEDGACHRYPPTVINEDGYAKAVADAKKYREKALEYACNLRHR